MPKHNLSRRSFMKLAGLSASLPVLLTCQKNTQSKRPNIVLIMADDMGFSDIGCYGGEISTPNIDKLAANGLRFTQFYNTARCCPTRASLLTGLYSHQTGIGAITKDRGVRGYRGFLSENCMTIAEALKRGNYHTMMAGKWHVGSLREHWPLHRGFDRYYGIPDGGGVYFYPCKFRKRHYVLNNEDFTPPDNWYSTDAFTDNALNFLDEAAGKNKPFFLYVAHVAPHFPLQAKPEDIAKYRGKYKQGWDVLRKLRHQRQIDMGLVNPDWPLPSLEAPDWKNVRNRDRMDLKMAIYAAQVECMDRNIGRILHKLEDMGAMDNTLILFLSDNGGTAEGGDFGFDEAPDAEPGTGDSYSSYGQGWANASNTPFRKYKMWTHEGGISTPLIAHWPAVIRQKGGITGQAGHCIDIMATCLDVAGLPYPKTYMGNEIIPLEGKSLVPVFEGNERPGHDALYWEHMGHRAVRQGQWKLVAGDEGKWELYDLVADRTEQNDLAALYPEKMEHLRQLYDNWADRCNVLHWDDVKNLP